MEANVNVVSPEIHLFSEHNKCFNAVVCNAFALDVISASAGAKGLRPITVLAFFFFFWHICMCEFIVGEAFGKMVQSVFLKLSINIYPWKITVTKTVCQCLFEYLYQRLNM